METIKLYHYDNFTGEFQCSTEPYKGSEIPPFSTENKPLKDKAGYACIFEDNAWKYVEDHRGSEYYSTLDGSIFVVNKLGALPENVTMIKPTSGDDVWNGDQWIPKPPPSKEELIAAAEQEKHALISDATEQIEPLQDAVDLDMATVKEVEMLEAWKVYRIQLNRIDTSLAPDISWPAKPE